MRPMLAFTINKLEEDVEFPCLVSAKLDGIRMYVENGICKSRSGKEFPNPAVQEMFGKSEFENFDGELIYGCPTDKNVLETTKKFVMSKSKPEMGKENLNFYVFDYVDTHIKTKFRYMILSQKLHIDYTNVKKVEKVYVEDIGFLLFIEEAFIRDGYEGIMIQSLDGIYKHGRSTKKEQYLGKFKRKRDDEFLIIGATELLHNENEATTNELGYTKRSSHKDNKTGGGKLGAFTVRDVKGRYPDFNVGTGFTDSQRIELWSIKDTLINKAFTTVEWFDYGIKEAPRHPTFKGLREIGY